MGIGDGNQRVAAKHKMQARLITQTLDPAHDTVFTRPLTNMFWAKPNADGILSASTERGRPAAG